MKTALLAWMAGQGKLKLYAAILGIFLSGALVTYGFASWYFVKRMDTQAAMYNAQISSLGDALDENAKVTLARLDTLSERVEFIVAELGRTSREAGTAARTATEASQTAKEAAQAVKGATP